MERLKQRIETSRRALTTLDELLSTPSDSKVIRDAATQRFKYSFEAVWKAAQAVLLQRFGSALAAPKPVVRGCFENGLLSEDEARLALGMVDHRNLTSHTYNESLADEIFSALPAYAKLLSAWITRLDQA